MAAFECASTGAALFDIAEAAGRSGTALSGFFGMLSLFGTRRGVCIGFGDGASKGPGASSECACSSA